MMHQLVCLHETNSRSTKQKLSARNFVDNSDSKHIRWCAVPHVQLWCCEIYKDYTKRRSDVLAFGIHLLQFDIFHCCEFSHQ